VLVLKQLHLFIRCLFHNCSANLGNRLQTCIRIGLPGTEPLRVLPSSASAFSLNSVAKFAFSANVKI
jgi:hypothetical protein